MPNHRGRHWLARNLDSLFTSFQVKTQSDLILDIFLSSSMDLSYFNANENESHSKILDIIENLTEGDVFIDIGANIGFFSLLASKKIGESGRVYCFEPSPREFNRLFKNIQLNKRSNLLPYNIALSDYMGESQFSVSESHTGLNSLSTIHGANNILVPVCPGDLLMSQLKMNTRKVIKIDVEGAEFFVLSGIKKILAQEGIEAVIVEITPKLLGHFNHTKEMIYELMSDFGFHSTVNSDEWQYDEIFIKPSDEISEAI